MLFKRYLEKRPSEMKKSGPFLPHCHLQASFKRLVQENTNGKEHRKHNHKKKLTSAGSVSREEFHQPQCKKNRGKEAEKLWYSEVWNKEYHRPRIRQQAWRLRLERRTRAADHFTSYWQHWSCSFKRRFKTNLSCKFHCIFVCSWPCLQFQSLQRHLEHRREWCRLEEHKWSKARIQASVSSSKNQILSDLKAFWMF